MTEIERRAILDSSRNMTLRAAPICMWCQRYKDPEGWGKKPTCDAFPLGIPDKILVDGFDHRKPFRGDGGVRFEARTDIAMEWTSLKEWG